MVKNTIFHHTNAIVLSCYYFITIEALRYRHCTVTFSSLGFWVILTVLSSIGFQINTFTGDDRIQHAHKILLLPHNNLCVQFNIAITNFFVSHTCEIRFNDIIGRRTVHMYSYAKIPNMADLHGQMDIFWNLIFFLFNSLDSVM